MIEQSPVVFKLHVIAAHEAEKVGKVSHGILIFYQHLLEFFISEQYSDAPDNSHRIVIVSIVPVICGILVSLKQGFPKEASGLLWGHDRYSGGHEQ